MIKLILPDKKKYSFNYNLDVSIKEILTKFSEKKGFLPDYYEAYDPKNIIVIDNNKSLKEYNLNIIHLRKVKSLQSSTDDGLEINHSNAVNLNLSIQSNDTSKYSQESPSDSKNTKEKKAKMWSRKSGDKSPVKTKKLDETSSSSSTKTKLSDVVNTSPKIKENLTNTENTKKKRQAPVPPDVTMETPVIDIPSPPSPSKLKSDACQSLPWLSDMSCSTEDHDDIDEYYSIVEMANLSTAKRTEKIETPICTSTECSMKINRLNTDNSSVHSLGCKPRSDHDDMSDPEDHVYSTVNKESAKTNFPKPNIELSSVLKTNQIERTSGVIERDTSPLPVSKMKEATELNTFRFPADRVLAQVEVKYSDNGTMKSRDDSDNSSIDTPILPKAKTKISRVPEQPNSKPKILSNKPQADPGISIFNISKQKPNNDSVTISSGIQEPPKPMARNIKPIINNTQDSLTSINPSNRTKFKIITNKVPTSEKAVLSNDLKGRIAEKEEKPQILVPKPNATENNKFPQPVISETEPQKATIKNSNFNATDKRTDYNQNRAQGHQQPETLTDTPQVLHTDKKQPDGKQDKKTAPEPQDSSSYLSIQKELQQLCLKKTPTSMKGKTLYFAAK